LLQALVSVSRPRHVIPTLHLNGILCRNIVAKIARTC
jgi:hypothetical protein